MYKGVGLRPVLSSLTPSGLISRQILASFCYETSPEGAIQESHKKTEYKNAIPRVARIGRSHLVFLAEPRQYYIEQYQVWKYSFLKAADLSEEQK